MMKDYEVLRAAVDTYGKEAQTDMMIEEMSELTKAILKYRRALRHSTARECEKERDSVLEEMADVQIMLNQMALIFGDSSKQEIAKLERLELKLAQAER